MRAVRRLLSVIWLALRPVSRFRRTHSLILDVLNVLITLGLLSGALANPLPTIVPLPSSLEWRIILVLAILLVLMTGAAYHLQRVEDGRPRIIVARDPYCSPLERIGSRPSMMNDGVMAWFLRIDFANEPIVPSSESSARNVVAKLTVFEADGKKQIKIHASRANEIFGRWFIPPDRSQRSVVMPGNGERFTLEFVDKMQGYFLSFPSNAERALDQTCVVEQDEFVIRLSLRGENCSGEFWIRVFSDGMGEPSAEFL